MLVDISCILETLSKTELSSNSINFKDVGKIVAK